MKDLLIRCSSLHKIMGNGKSASGLSVTATSYIKQLVKEHVFKYKSSIQSKYLEKGIDCELDAIKLYNDHFFTSHDKNEVTLHNEFIKGTCDVTGMNEVIDFKCSWDADSFPATETDLADKCKKAGYEWQLRGYMWLYNKDTSKLVDCLLDTPEYLIEYVSDRSSHEVGHIPPGLRMTILKFSRDTVKEDLIKSKVEACRLFADEYLNEILTKNKS